jgi:hypothetical protein
MNFHVSIGILVSRSSYLRVSIDESENEEGGKGGKKEKMREVKGERWNVQFHIHVDSPFGRVLE